MPNMIQTQHATTYWVIVSTVLHIACFIGVCIHALQRRRNASSTLLWMFIAWSFPLIGPLFYLSFGIDRVEDKGLRKKATDQLLMHQRTHRHIQGEPFIAWLYNFRTDIDLIQNSFCRNLTIALDALLPEHPLLNGNTIEPLLCGEEAYPLMLQAIREAQDHIHLQSFIFNNDETGRLFLSELKKKADAGIHVRVLYDRFGSAHALWSGLFRKYRKPPHFEIIGWTQANPFKRQFQINLRNHRKTLIVDGKTAFFGGVNISSENINTPNGAAIRDYHFNVEGPLVHELQYSFLRDWFFMTEEPLEKLLCQNHFPKFKSIGTGLARIVDSGPSTKQGLIAEVFFNAIIMAKNQILLVTPYFVPTPDILQALRSATRRGVDVRMILPEKNNHVYAGFASKALYEELLDAGVKIYERQPPFIHAKAMLIDSAVAIVGTANMDVRSLELNYETSIVIADEHAVNKLKLIIHEDIELSTEIHLNAWLQRPAHQKLAENLCSLLTPIL